MAITQQPGSNVLLLAIAGAPGVLLYEVSQASPSWNLRFAVIAAGLLHPCLKCAVLQLPVYLYKFTEPNFSTYSSMHMQTAGGEGAWRARQAARLCHLWPVCQVAWAPCGSHLAAAGLGGQLWLLEAAGAALERGAIAWEDALQLQVGAMHLPVLATATPSFCHDWFSRHTRVSPAIALHGMLLHTISCMMTRPCLSRNGICKVRESCA